MRISEKQMIGELVADDYRTAEVFVKFGIDFCCKGAQSIAAVCERKKLDCSEVLAELERALTLDTKAYVNFKAWPADLLADYIEKKHHRFVQLKTPLILQYLKKLLSVHGDAHPELQEIYAVFSASAINLAAHMKKEELILFPFIRKLETQRAYQEHSHFGSVVNPISMMKHDHDDEGERFRVISQLTSNYTPPSDACSTYKVCFALLKEFEADLHQHIHLENNILFPSAEVLEMGHLKN
jgi:regulator of cell morphogenesis and NO signaling